MTTLLFMFGYDNDIINETYLQSKTHNFRQHLASNNSKRISHANITISFYVQATPAHSQPQTHSHSFSINFLSVSFIARRASVCSLFESTTAVAISSSSLIFFSSVCFSSAIVHDSVSTCRFLLKQ